MKRALVLVAVGVMVATTITPAQAQVVYYNPPERTIFMSFVPDQMYTSVQLGFNGRGANTILARVCVWYQYGWSRNVKVTNGSTVVKVRASIDGAKKCIHPYVRQLKSTTRTVVSVDYPGPWNPSADRTVRVH